MTDPPDWAARQWPLVLAVEDLDEAAQGQHGFTSFTMSPAECRVDVYWKGRLPTPVADVVDLHDGPITIVVHENAPFTKAELDPAADRLFLDPELGYAAGVSVISSTWPSQGTRVEGGVLLTDPPPDLEAAEDFLSLELGVPVELGFDVISGDDLGRKDDTAPWYSGGQLFIEQARDEYEDCSTGFAVKDTDNYYMLTVAHCGKAVGQKAFNGDKSKQLGPIAARDTGLDSATIRVPSGAGKVFTGRPTSNTWIPVEKKTKVVVGQIVFTSGAATGENHDIEVFDVNHSFTDKHGWKTTDAVRAKHKDGKIAAGGGDSGGPVYVPTKDKDKALAAGIIKNADKDWKEVKCRRDDDTTLCVDSIRFIKIDAILTQWNVTLVTTAP
ncbi:MAG TPA: hypothetical protein VF062_24115 [Candidatus Limnocylindrales bacterium]